MTEAGLPAAGPRPPEEPRKGDGFKRGSYGRGSTSETMSNASNSSPDKRQGSGTPTGTDSGSSGTERSTGGMFPSIDGRPSSRQQRNKSPRLQAGQGPQSARGPDNGNQCGDGFVLPELQDAAKLRNTRPMTERSDRDRSSLGKVRDDSRWMPQDQDLSGQRSQLSTASSERPMSKEARRAMGGQVFEDTTLASSIGIQSKGNMMQNTMTMDSRDMFEENIRLRRELDDLRVTGIAHNERRRREDAEQETVRLRREVEERRIHAAIEEERRNTRRADDEVARLKCELEDGKEDMRKLKEELDKMREELKATGGEENRRLRRELAERRAKVGSLEQTVVGYIAARDRTERREKWLKQYGFQGRILMHDVATAIKVVTGWRTAMAVERAARADEKAKLSSRDYVRKIRETVVGGSFARELEGLKEFVWVQWRGLLAEAQANKKVRKAEETAALARKKMAPALLRCVDKNGGEFLDELFSYWVSLMREAHLTTRALAAEDAAQKALAEKEEHMALGTQAQHMMNSAMKQLKRANAAEVAANMATAWGAWREEVAETKRQREVAEEAAKAKLLAAAVRSKAIAMAMNNVNSGLLSTALGGWKDELAAAKRANYLKKQGMDKSLRAITGSNEALLESIYEVWRRAAIEGRSERMLEEVRQQASAEKARLQLQRMEAFEKSFAQQDTVLLATAVGGWRREVGGKGRRAAATQRCLRQIANSDEMLVKEVWAVWSKCKQGLAAAMRKIEGSDKDRKREVFSIMREFVELEKRERIGAKAREQLERARAQKLAMVEQNLNMTGRGLVMEIWGAWHSLLEPAKLRKKMKDGGMSSAMKRIADASMAALADSFAEWRIGYKEWKQARELTLATRQKELLEKCRQRAISALERNLQGQAKALLELSAMAWKEEAHAAKSLRKRKQLALERGMRMINGGDEFIKREWFAALAKDTQVGKEERVGRVRQRRMADLGRGAYIRLRKHLGLMQVWEAWCVRTFGT